jgi:hypothetical protein
MRIICNYLVLTLSINEMVDVSKLSLKELKAYVRLYKKVHCLPFAKLKKAELVSLARRIQGHEELAHMSEEHFTKHQEEMKKVREMIHSSKAKSKEADKLMKESDKVGITKRPASEKQLAHRKLFGEYKKAKSGMSFAEFKASRSAPAKKEPKKAKPGAKQFKKKVDVGAPTPVEPTMKVVEVEKKAVKALVKAVEPEKKKRVLSPEHLAKMKAGREKARAEKTKN